jgi:hypothetical protein
MPKMIPDSDLSEFQNNWLSVNGCRSLVRIKQIEGKGMGLVFSELPEDYEGILVESPITLVEMPKSLAINGYTLLKALDEHLTAKKIFISFLTFIDGGHLKCIKKFTERLSICLFLVISKSVPLGKTNYDAYLKCLPPIDDLNSPIFWDEEEFTSCLSGTPLYTACLAKSDKVMGEFNEIYEHLLEPLSLLDGYSALSDIDASDYFWADGIFASRVISFKKCDDSSDPVFDSSSLKFDFQDVHLVPLIDMCNHDSNSPVARWEVNEKKILLLSYPSLKLNSKMEITISYGSKSNSEMLFTHGFASSDFDANETFHFPLFINQQDLLLKQKINALKHFSLKPIIELSMNKVLEIADTKPKRYLVWKTLQPYR